MKDQLLRLGTLTLLGLATAGTLAAAPVVPERVPSVSFKQGRTQVAVHGRLTLTTNDVQVAGLALVRTNGIFTVQSGKERQLREGQIINADATLSSPDGSIMPIVDHVSVKSGRAWVVRDGNAAPVAGEFALPNGSKVTPDGNIRATDGRLTRLLDGQLLKLDGGALPVTDTAQLQGGKVVLFKDGGRLELRRGQTVAMSDGSKVSGDGFVLKADGSRLPLKEGELVKLEGATLRR